MIHLLNKFITLGSLLVQGIGQAGGGQIRWGSKGGAQEDGRSLGNFFFTMILFISL